MLSLSSLLLCPGNTASGDDQHGVTIIVRTEGAIGSEEQISRRCDDFGA